MKMAKNNANGCQLPANECRLQKVEREREEDERERGGRLAADDDLQ